MKQLLIYLVGIVYCAAWLYGFYRLAIRIEALEWYWYAIIQVSFLASIVGLGMLIEKIKELKF